MCFLPMVPIRSMEVDEPKETESVHNSTSLMDSPNPSPCVSKPSPPFPSWLKGKKVQSHVEKIREILSEIKINIPLLDLIQQIPPYARFHKGMCTTMRATNVPKSVFLASSLSSIISNQVPIQCKAMRCPTFSIVIDNHNIHRALLASVSLLAFIVYEWLRLGELRPTKMVL